MVFISYSWDSEEHTEKAARLVRFLRKSGVEVIWDQDVRLGKRLPSFMEESLRECDQVLFICTPRYKAKADGRDGGVGYETNVITADVYRNHNDMKYIPVLFDGNWDDSMPLWAGGKLGADLRNESMREYEKLLDALQEPEAGEEAAEERSLPAERLPEERRALPADQPPEDPALPEERRALREIYQELLDLKAWLVQLEYGDAGLRDPGGSGKEMEEKAARLRKTVMTYDFLLKTNVLTALTEFFRWWKSFLYFYTNLEEELAREANQKRGALDRIFYVSPRSKLINGWRYSKEACNKALTAISKRLA